jgi:hypothetical protein
MTKIINIEDGDGNEQWALVELHRWQYGHLPGESGTNADKEPLDIPIALRKIAAGIEKGCKPGGKPDDMISPFNLCEVLKYLAGKFKLDWREPK